MREILGKAKTIRELLKGVKYSIDYYQRDYKWGEKQIIELLNDLSSKFLEEYRPEHERKKVADYPHYFLGSIIISKKDSANFIVDGQQRLTSLTLLLVLLRNMQKNMQDQVNVDELIFSTKFGLKSFNIEVDERMECMNALYENGCYDLNDDPESVQNLVVRYGDLEENFPEELTNHALPYFIDWLLENVHIVEITAYSDDDAYTIFETMNDRGLSLSQSDMLKGYLLANIDQGKRVSANNRWRDRIRQLNEAGKEVVADFFKTWLRSQYSKKIRERKRNAKPEDFDRIGAEFHRWVRDNSEEIGLNHSDDFYSFITRDFEFYSRQYLIVLKASKELIPGLESIFYNSQHGFSLQYMLLLAPLKPGDDPELVKTKKKIVSTFINILITWRLWNFRSIAYSTMQYAMFNVMRDIRDLDASALALKLHEKLMMETENFDSNKRLYLHQQNRYSLHRILARITDYVEAKSGMPSRYFDYIKEGRNRYEVEHIWANHFERHTDEFSHQADFAEYRNRIGALLLLPKSFNSSYGDLPYTSKLPHYNTQNLLARSLHPLCYEYNPGFFNFKNQSSLPFKPCPEFKKSEIDSRGELYKEIAKRNWDPDVLLRILEEA